jgi:hypothetical protein
MRSHKAVSGVTLVFAQISVAYGANPYYALPTRLGTALFLSVVAVAYYIAIPMRVDMFKLYTHHINLHRKTKKLYMKKKWGSVDPHNP